MLTQKRLKEVLEYDLETGLFFWKVTMGKAYTGAIAGHKTVNGYIMIKIDKNQYFAHRLAWFFTEGYFPENQIDHKNRIKKDNRRSNLRHVSRSCNLRNSKMYKNNSSGITGIYRTRSNTWSAMVCNLGKIIYLGVFQNFADAVKARWEGEKKYGYPNCNRKSTAYLYLKKRNLLG